jgi:Domain of unknown function (DUF5658)
MGRRMLASCLSVLLMSVPAWAADRAADASVTLSARADAASTGPAADGVAADSSAAEPAAAPAPLLLPVSTWKPAARPSILPALYGGSAALQAFDAYSTLKALRLGGTEANPVMKGIVGNPAVFIGIKAALTAASIVSAERMWRDGHQLRAIAMMAISNGIMAAVAAHNASVVSSLK